MDSKSEARCRITKLTSKPQEETMTTAPTFNNSYFITNRNELTTIRVN